MTLHPARCDRLCAAAEAWNRFTSEARNRFTSEALLWGQTRVSCAIVLQMPLCMRNRAWRYTCMGESCLSEPKETRGQILSGQCSAFGHKALRHKLKKGPITKGKRHGEARRRSSATAWRAVATAFRSAVFKL
eukprot:296264-Pleurochrysis_carterae.AAC.1